jgi:uncharacterized membrane protein YfcA
VATRDKVRRARNEDPMALRERLASERAIKIPHWCRRVAQYAIPAAITLVWLVAMLATDSLGRAIDHWESSLTMVFGSFLGGASPAGGSAVAFPVFTKLLDVPAPVARTFALSIQAVGLTTATAMMLLARRPLEPRVIATGVLAGGAGFVAALLLLGDADTPFWEPTIPAPYVKVTFTLLLAAMSYSMLLALRDGAHHHGATRIPYWNARVWVGLVTAAFVGGAISSLIGTGANVLLFLFAVMMAGLHPRVGVASSIVAMALLSILGFVLLGLVDGQLDVALGASGEVVRVGGQPVGPLPAKHADLLGLWIAAIPVVAWGGPLGSYVMYQLAEQRLIAFVGVLAAVEVISTAVLLDELHRDPALIAYCVGGLATAAVAVPLLRGHRRRILGLPVGATSRGALSDTE